MVVSEQAITMQNALHVKKEGLASIDAGDGEINLSGVKTVDSAAVSVMLSWIRLAKKKNLKLQIRCVPASLDSLFSLYGIHTLFEAFILNENRNEH